jgi:tetratricopeptide (TPR) repeat protein
MRVGIAASWTRLFLVLAILTGFCANVVAQSAPPMPRNLSEGQLRSEAERLFQITLVDPKNLDASFRYAEISAQLGDFEAAIGALERMIFYARDLPRVELELGLLYFRLGSYEMARSHFERAKQLDSPPEVRQRVDSFLRQIERRISPTQYAFYAQVGLRYQSNANAGPNTALVRALGFDATLSSAFRKQPDWNAFGIISARYIYDFENQRGDAWETNLTTYYARQFKFGRLNLGFAELDTGPRLGLGALTGFSVRPYALVNAVTLGDRPYLTSGGGGASLRYQALWGQIEPGVEYRDRAYRNSGLYPTAADQSGHQVIGYVLANGFFESVPGLRWQAKASVARSASTIAAYAYRQAGFDAALPYEMDGNLALFGRRWTLAPTVGYYWTNYDQPNVLVDPTMARRDREWRAGVVLDVNVYENFGVTAQAQYLQTLSNLPNYATQNWVVSIGPTVRF